MIRIDSDQDLNILLTQPNEADIAFARRLRGDTMILGAGGKMGPTLAQRLLRALRSAGRSSRVIAVSRFQSSDAERELADSGVETVACDLLDPDSVKDLPLVENVLFLAGRKFGSAGDPEVTWAMNTVVASSRMLQLRLGSTRNPVSGESGSSSSTLRNLKRRA